MTPPVPKEQAVEAAKRHQEAYACLPGRPTHPCDDNDCIMARYLLQPPQPREAWDAWCLDFVEQIFVDVIEISDVPSRHMTWNEYCGPKAKELAAEISDKWPVATVGPQYGMCLAFIGRVYGELSEQMAMFGGTGDFDGAKERLARELKEALRFEPGATVGAFPGEVREAAERVIGSTLHGDARLVARAILDAGRQTDAIAQLIAACQQAVENYEAMSKAHGIEPTDEEDSPYRMQKAALAALGIPPRGKGEVTER